HGPHLLILDEPTNHLDVDAREALVCALADYRGAVILISHDRHLMDTCVDRLWIVREGTVGPYDGDMQSYRAECLAERSGDADRSRPKTPVSAPAKPSPQQVRRQAAAARAALSPLKERVLKAEGDIEHIRRKIAEIEAALADGTLYAQDIVC